MSLCAAYLAIARFVANRKQLPTDEGCIVTLVSSDDFFYVESFYGAPIWEGRAHCEFCARAEAMVAMRKDCLVWL